LTSAEPDFGSAGVGIWNGTAFLYQTSTSSGYFSGWWDALSAVFRYGPLSPYRTNSAVAALLKKFALLYNPKFLSEAGAALGVSEMVERVGLGREMTGVRGDEWALKTVGVGERWMGEIMEGSTRTNVSGFLLSKAIG
jgi:prenylcysteine oxidase/farnesylcysteine lyase